MGEKIKEIIRLLYEAVLDIIYPYEYKCIICEAEDVIGICPCCKSKIAKVKIQDEILSYGYYGGILKELIFQFKYKNNFTSGRIMSKLLEEIIREEKIIADVICYVPMCKKSIKRRGYNQCEIISKDLSRELKIPVAHCIKKIKETREQKTLSKAEREINMLGAFNITNNSEIENKNVLLIDDVLTTGATVKECIRILKKYNVNKVTVLTIAKSNI